MLQSTTTTSSEMKLGDTTSYANVPVQPVMVSEACKSWLFPEKVRGITTAPVGYVLLFQVPLVSILQGGR